MEYKYELHCHTGAVTKMELSGSNVLRFELADGTTILARPSGTEPKIKVYILARGKDAADAAANAANASVKTANAPAFMKSGTPF